MLSLGSAPGRGMQMVAGMRHTCCKNGSGTSMPVPAQRRFFWVCLNLVDITDAGLRLLGARTDAAERSSWLCSDPAAAASHRRRRYHPPKKPHANFTCIIKACERHAARMPGKLDAAAQISKMENRLVGACIPSSPTPSNQGHQHMSVGKRHRVCGR